MNGFTDDELLAELKRRFEQERKSLFDLTIVNRKLLEMNRKLQQSESLRSNFVSNIRNEIFNPLSSIMGLARQLSAGGIPPHSVAATAHVIFAEAFDLDFQLTNVLTAAEFEAGDFTPEPAQVDIGSVVRDVIDSFSLRSAAKGVTVTFEENETPLLFVTDAGKFRLIVANLLANAIEYSHRDGTVELRGERQGEKLSLTVADHGTGIDPDNIPLLFERFRQGENGPCRTHRGHGLGLSVVKAVIDALEGTISVSGKRGNGALFTVMLPSHVMAEDSGVFAEDGNIFVFEEVEEK